jgi:hypothetical protein
MMDLRMQAVAPCSVDYMQGSVVWKDGEQAVKDNFRKQVMRELKVEQSDRFKTGVLVGAGVSIVVIGGIILLVN